MTINKLGFCVNNVIISHTFVCDDNETNLLYGGILYRSNSDLI